MSYEKALAHTLRWEGGYSDIAEDTGGRSYQGISQKHNPKWQGWPILDKLKPRHGQIYPELNKSVAEYYRKQYWDKIQAGNIKDVKVAGFLFDYFVNSGSHAVKAIQRIVGVTDDGIVGSKTIQAINEYKGDLFTELKQARLAFVDSIVKNNPSQGKFKSGWVNRINSFI